MSDKRVVAGTSLLRLDIDAEPPIDLGPTPQGWQRVVEIRGGTFSGPRLSGTIRASGQDSARVRGDDVFEIDVRLVLATDDGALIRLCYRGLWHSTTQSIAAVVRHDIPLDAAGSWFRTVAFFQTADARYEWLNRCIAVGIGRPKMVEGNAGIVYDLFAID